MRWILSIWALKGNMLTSIAMLTCVYELTLALMLTFLPYVGKPGKTLSELLRKAPWLDLVLSLLIWLPWFGGSFIFGWKGLLSVLFSQVIALQLWIFTHEFIHRQTAHGARIVRTLNRRFGWWQNHLALWVTILVIPIFFLIRIAEVFLYPWLIWLVGFPKYKHNEWVTVSRFKFEGLVGHDLLWCLYCDWMTGVYSLGAEMLRNVESFWCPIRFCDEKKCENCQIDFPDIDNGWVPAEGTMEDVVETLRHMYGDRLQSWFGHPERH